MFLYILPSIIFIISICEYIKDEKIKKYNLIFLFFIMSILCTFRSNSSDIFYGYDTNEYIKFFNNPSLDGGNFEIGYKFINFIIRFFTDDYRVLFLIISALTMIFLYKYISYYTDNKIIALLAYVCIFYFIRDFSQIRASLAYAICAYSSIYIVENKPIKFILYIALSSLIHFSSIFMLLMYPISKLKLNKKILYFIVFISVILFNVDLMKYIINIVSLLGENKLTRSFTIYTNYYGARGLDGKMILYIMISLIGIYIKDYNSIKSNKYNINIYMIVMGILVAGLFNSSEVISVRMSELFITPMIIILSKIKDIAKDKNLEFIFHILSGMFLLIYNLFFIKSLAIYGI